MRICPARRWCASALRRRFHGNDMLFRIGREFNADHGFITQPLGFVFTNWRAGVKDTPLASIRVFGEHMRLGRVTRPEKILEYGEYILDFSRIESSEKQYKFCATDIVDLVAHTVSGFLIPLRESNVTIDFSPPLTDVPPMSIDRDAIGQALNNLLDNAVKYSGNRKEIEVAIVAHGARSGDRGVTDNRSPTTDNR
jgi:hypothetical protein